MIQWGINALNHGSSLAVFKDSELLSWVTCKDNEIDTLLITDALHRGAPDRIFWYERPWLKKARQVYAGQYATALDMSVLPKRYLNKIRVHYAPVTYTPHHASHAAAGYYSSPFNHCAIVVLDAIGEFESATIWEAKYGEMKKVWSRSYPHSLGLFYSAFTKLIGLTPIKDEYLLQKMAAQGDKQRYIKLALPD
jgi:carbamoyltransferase